MEQNEFVIDVYRKWKKATYTIGKVSVDRGAYTCECIEDRDRGLTDSMTPGEIAARKVYGETAIPAGKYKIKMTHSPKFGQKEAYAWCKGVLPEIVGVKGYSGIRIHAGNTAKDSLGCLLPGRNTEVGRVTDSMNTVKRIVTMINAAMKEGRPCYVNIH